jgi:3'-phosphoadenosine 5'-phosphosulfate sulfotransferase (PAPS reductase)/FAD synthetase
MAKVSLSELNERLNWNLYQKIDHSLGVIEQFYKAFNGHCVVMFSSGKDSTVLLHLARRIYPEMRGCFINTTNEFSEILNFSKTVENIDTVMPEINFINVVKQYGFPIISKKVAKAIRYLRHPDNNEASRNLYLTGYNRKGEYCSTYKLAKKWHFLIDVPFDITDQCCEFLKHKPANTYQRINEVYPLTGIMAVNSQSRKINYLNYGCNIINGRNSISRPMEIWADKDIWDYIKEFKVPYCDVYDKGEKNTGCAYCGFGCHLEKESRFLRLKKREPKRYKQMMQLENNGVTYYQALENILKPRQSKIIF